MLDANIVNLHHIYNHPFNRQLFKGTLSPAVFGRYLRDDYYYLHQFSSILQTLSKKKIKPDLASQLQYLAKNIINNELSMQLQYKEHLTNTTDYIPGPSISAYTDYLSKTIRHSEPSVALSAVLPCFWIYHQLGVRHKNFAKIDINPFQEWITSYSSSDFVKATKHLAKTVTLLGEQSTPAVQSKMRLAFKKSVQFELAFFEELYTLDNTLKLTA